MFQAVVLSILSGVSEFLPIGSTGHMQLVPWALGWEAPPAALRGGFYAATAAALFIHLRHDWASVISGGLRVVLLRKKPMTLDERLLGFLFLSTLPFALGILYFREVIESFDWRPELVGCALAAMVVPMLLGERVARRNKGMFDWNWFDALLIGFWQALALIPGVGLLAPALSGALLRSFQREAASKYVCYAMTPVLTLLATLELKGVDFRSASPASDLSWLTFWVALVVAFFAALLTLNAFTQQSARRTLGGFAVYRLLFGLGIAAYAWWKTRLTLG